MKIRKLYKILQYFSYISLAIILFSCETKQHQNRINEDTFELIMTTYKSAWVSGANASTNACNEGSKFNDKIGKEVFKKDSLKFVSLVFSN